MNKALFLDRDGVINIDREYIYKIEDFIFADGIFDVLSLFQKNGYLLIIITNQSGIARGYYTENDFKILNDWMLGQFESRGIKIARVYYSIYHPELGIGEYKRDDFDRKPNPGMILKAQKDFDIDLSASILVGDKESDVEAGINAGVKKIIHLKNEKYDSLKKTKAGLTIENIRELINFV